MTNFVYYLFILFTTVNGVTINETPFQCYAEIHHYSLTAGQAAMFQTPDYPKSMSTGTPDGSVNCSASLSRGDNTGDLVIFLVNGNINEFKFTGADEIDGMTVVNNAYYNSNTFYQKIYYGRNNPTVNFTFMEESNVYDWTAFQAFVYAPNSSITSDCLLNNEVFDLTKTSENIIIPLFTFGNRSNEVNETCFWRFNIPADYYLKLVINHIDLDTENGESLEVGSKFSSLIKDVGVYITEGPLIQIFYTKYAHGYKKFGFEGYATLFQYKTLSNTACGMGNDNITQGIYYTNFNHESGYPDDTSCTAPLIVKKGESYLLGMKKNFYEYYADSIVIQSPQGNTYDVKSYYIFEPTQDDHYHLNFTADNTVSQGGFELLQTNIGMLFIFKYSLCMLSISISLKSD